MTDRKTEAPALDAASFPRTPTQRTKRPEDTAEGCRALAEDNLRRADLLTVEHARWSYRRSAEAWRTRAALLERREAQFEARRRRARP